MSGLVHEALVYSTERELVDGAAPFLREGIDAGESVVSVTSGRNAALLADALGARAADVRFVDADEWYGAPGRTLAAYRDYIHERRSHGRIRVVGEPVWAGRTAREINEWTRYEAAINVSFADLPVSILCPYDAAALPSAVVAHARCTHPVVREGGERTPTAGFDPHGFASGLDEHELDDPGALTADLELPIEDSFLRRTVRTAASVAGVRAARIPDVVLGVHEVAASTEPPARVRMWATESAFVVEVVHGGGAADPFAGYVDPNGDGARGRALWLARQLADLVEIRTRPAATVVRLSFARG